MVYTDALNPPDPRGGRVLALRTRRPILGANPDPDPRSTIPMATISAKQPAITRTRLWCTGAADADGANALFDTLEARIRTARRRIDIHMYVWRSDEIGNRIGRALLDAANRGVQVHITKDLGACMYERIEMNRKSFFDRPLPGWKRASYRMLRPLFPGTYVQDEYDGSVGLSLLDHPAVTVEWINRTHTKFLLFDNTNLLVGSVNFEDRHRGYFDYVVELSGSDTIQQFHRRLEGHPAPDPPTDGEPDFVVNGWRKEPRSFHVKPCVLGHLRAAAQSVYIEMAYLGDSDINRAIIDAASRGVTVTLLCSREANIGNDINLQSIHHLYASGRITLYLAPKMIHAKLMLFDDRVLLMGSANLSVFSLQKAGELDVLIRNDPALIRAVRAEAEARMAVSTKVLDPTALPRYNRIAAALQQAHQKLNPN